MIRVKICGITSVEDGLAVARSGADAIGFVFYPASPRVVDVKRAAEIAAAVGPFVTTVALFVNPSEQEVNHVLATLKPHVLQFHGDETAGFCEKFDRPYLRAIRVKEDTDIDAEIGSFSSAAGFIFDAWNEDLYGGTGQTFDWTRISGFSNAPVVLAGGLTAENVGEAIELIRPYGVDVSGGVESSPGLKDTRKIMRFVHRAKQMDDTLS